jgi:hypothetical protein
MNGMKYAVRLTFSVLGEVFTCFVFACFVFACFVTVLWGTKSFNEVKKYHSTYGHCNIPRTVPRLGDWVNNQRRLKKKYDNGERSSLTSERVRMLDDINFQWNLKTPIVATESNNENLT